MYDNIKKSLDRIDNPLIKQTAEYLISNIETADDDASADIAKSALLLYLNATAPGILKSDIAVEHALSKSFDATVEAPKEEESPVEYEKRLKKVLAESGIYYFGSLSKHQTKLGRPGDPKAPGDQRYEIANPPHKEKGGKPHLPTQKLPGHSHGQRPGRRELINLLRDYQRLTGHEIGSRNEMLTWNHSQLKQYVNRLYGPKFLEHYKKGSGRRNKAATGYGEQNTVEADRLGMVAEYLKGPYAPSHFGKMPKDTLAQRVDSLRNIPEATRSGGKPAGRGGNATIEPRAASDAEVAVSEGATDKIPELIHSMNQVPKDNIMWQNFERLKPKLQRNIQSALANKPRSASFMNQVLNEAVKNPANLKRERSTGNQDMPRWMSEEAANDPEVDIDRAAQEAYARQYGWDLPPTAEQQAELDAAGERAAGEKKKRKILETRAGGAKAVTEGDVRRAIEAANDQFELRSLTGADIKNIKNIAADLRRQGVGKDEALRILGNLAVNMDTLLAGRGEGVKLNQKERQGAQSSVNRLLNRLRSLGYEELAAYFDDKLNVGETIHATFANAPKPKSIKKSDDSMMKFLTRLEKYHGGSN